MLFRKSRHIHCTNSFLLLPSPKCEKVIYYSTKMKPPSTLSPATAAYVCTYFTFLRCNKKGLTSNSLKKKKVNSRDAHGLEVKPPKMYVSLFATTRVGPLLSQQRWKSSLDIPSAEARNKSEKIEPDGSQEVTIDRRFSSTNIREIPARSLRQTIIPCS